MNMNILVTGGASGLGESITKNLAVVGHNLIITYCHSKDSAIELEKKFSVKSIKCDFTKPEDIENLINEISNLDLDVLVNNALTTLSKQHFHKTKKEQFQQSFEHDVVPTLAITQAAIKTFRKKKFGKIITILSSSIIGNPPIGWSEYSSNKAYLLSMSKSWAIENAKQNITSNCISPAFMQTPLHQKEDERIIENMIKSHPLKKLLKTEEVAQSVSFLVNATQQINGTNMIINAAIN